MGSILEAVDALERALEVLGAADWTQVGDGERVGLLDRWETCVRRQRAVAHAVIHGLDAAELGAPVAVVVADVLRISRSEARRRVRDAEQLAPRTSLSGQLLPPVLPATAAAWAAGVLDPEHLRTIQKFMRELPDHVGPGVAEYCEALLAEKAALLRPDQLEVVADRLAITVNPDGVFSDEDRARKRGFVWCGRQRSDGMSVGKLFATPQLRAMVEAWCAKFAAPGMCNPADHTPTVTGEPSSAVADRDDRSHAQRQHDALAALVRGQLGDPKLGTHNGLPVTIIATATLEQLQSGAGVAVTAGRTLLPMRDLIRMASHAYHYLCVFDKHTQRPLYLGRTKRIATADQRIVLHALVRGCTAPGCDVPGYFTEVHHTDEWADGGATDIDKLTLACTSDHGLITPGGWQTRIRPDGTCEWIPPPGSPQRGGTNTFHHPERFLDNDGP